MALIDDVPAPLPPRWRASAAELHDLRRALLLINDGFSKLAKADGSIAVEVRRLLDAPTAADLEAKAALEDARRREEREVNEAWGKSLREARAADPDDDPRTKEVDALYRLRFGAGAEQASDPAVGGAQ